MNELNIEWNVMLDSLRIKNFRCFEDLEIESLGRVNLIVGKNNVGKSTLLEAMQFFSFGQSVNSHNSAENALLQIIKFIGERRQNEGLQSNNNAILQRTNYLMNKPLDTGILIGDKNKIIKTQIKTIHHPSEKSTSFAFTFSKNDTHYDFGINSDFEIFPMENSQNDFFQTTYQHSFT